MRKRNCKKLFDTLLWTAIYMLPIFLFLILNYAPNIYDGSIDTTIFTLGEICSDYFGVDGGNLFANTLYELFGDSGIMTLFNEGGTFAYLAYLISVNILHLFVDIILALPRFCHKFLDKFAHDEE